jgi:hypothetical protein
MRAVFGSLPYPDRKEISRKSPKPTASTLTASEIALRATPQERGKAKKNIGSEAENTRNPIVIKLQWDMLNFYLVKLKVNISIISLKDLFVNLFSYNFINLQLATRKKN